MGSNSNLKTLTLHAHGTGPNPYKVGIVLELLKIPYQVKLWEFGDSDKNGVKGKTFTAITPNGRVPALEDPNTGVTSWESGACVNYLLRVYDKENALGPRGNTEQARVDFEKWIFMLVSQLGPMMGQANWFRHYHDKKNDDAQQRYDAQCHVAYKVLNGQLEKTDGFILEGKEFSAVDAHFYPWVAQAKFAQLPLDSYPAIQKWLEKCGGIKEVKAAYEKVPNGEKM